MAATEGVDVDDEGEVDLRYPDVRLQLIYVSIYALELASRKISSSQHNVPPPQSQKGRSPKLQGMRTMISISCIQMLGFYTLDEIKY